MNVLKKVDDRLLQWTQKLYMDLHGKSKILSLALIIFTFGLLIEKPFSPPFSWIFLSLFMLSIVIFVYEKRAWYRLRKIGAKEAEGFFFEDSAHPLRKWAFLSACIFLLSRSIFLPNYSIYSLIQIYGLNNYIVFTVVDMLFLSLYVSEFLRLVVSTGSSWSNKKHFSICLIVYLLLITIQIVGLYYLGFLDSVVL
jgi:hypothetical protein